MATSTISDAQILSLLRGDDDRGIRQLYKQYYGMIEYLVRHNFGRKGDARHIFRDTVIYIYERAQNPAFELSTKLRTYIYSVARNIWMEELRSQRRRMNNYKDFEEYTDVRISMDENEVKHERMTKIEHALDKLGENCRRILLLHYYYHRSMGDIAQEVGMEGENAVLSQKHRCMKELKHKLAYTFK